MSIQQILKRPYPVGIKKWPMIIAISIFIGLFLMIFQPFGLQFIEMENKRLFLLGYGLVTFTCLLLNLILLPLIFTDYFSEDNWTVQRHIIWLMVDIVLIAAGNYLYSVAFQIFPWVGIDGFLRFVGFTIPIGLFPAVILTFIQQNRYLKNNLAASQEINQSISHKEEHMVAETSHLKLDSGNQTFDFAYNQIVYIESEGNYVKVHFLEADKVRFELIRNTLKNVSDLIEGEKLFRCHRAFIVNLDYVEKVDGNSQGYTLQLNHSETQIPVSRSYTKSFKEAMIHLIEG